MTTVYAMVDPYYKMALPEFRDTGSHNPTLGQVLDAQTAPRSRSDEGGRKGITVA